MRVFTGQLFTGVLECRQSPFYTAGAGAGIALCVVQESEATPNYLRVNTMALVTARFLASRRRGGRCAALRPRRRGVRHVAGTQRRVR